MADRMASNAEISATISKIRACSACRKKDFTFAFDYRLPLLGGELDCTKLIEFSAPAARLYCCHAPRNRSAQLSATLLGLQFISPVTTKHCRKPAPGARHLRGHAYGWWKVALLPVASAGFRADCGCDLALDLFDARPGGTTGADGHPRGCAE